MCIEANSSFLWDTELRPGNAGTWDGSVELMASSFVNVPPDIRELRVRADAGFGFNPVLEILEARAAQYAVVARLTQAFKRLLPGLRYESVNKQWEMAEFDHRSHGWPHARQFVVARRFIPNEEAEATLFTMGRYMYRAWVTNMDLTASGVWHFYDGRAGMEPRICELRRLRIAEDPDLLVCGQRAVPGDHSACLQLGHCVSAELPGGILAELDASKATLQTVLAPR